MRIGKKKDEDWEKVKNEDWEKKKMRIGRR